MTNYARIDSNGIAMETIEQNPSFIFHPDLSSLFEEVPDYVKPGWVREEGVWREIVPPPLPEEPQATPEPIGKAQFLERLTSAERIAIRSARSSDPIADDFLMMLDVTGGIDLFAPDIEAAMEHFVAAGYLAPDRIAEIKIST